MADIKKFSLVYDAAEDRIAWDTEDAEGGGTRLWLTQRMCRELVGAVIPRLPKTAAAPDIAPDAAPEQEAAVQSWEQAAAASNHSRTTGVRVSPETTAGLVSAVHITASNAGMSLTFDFAGQQRAIAMDAMAIRQAMNVLHGLFVAANWPTDVWPGWIAQPVTAAANLRSLN
jgi:hypothetical protein